KTSGRRIIATASTSRSLVPQRQDRRSPNTQSGVGAELEIGGNRLLSLRLEWWHIWWFTHAYSFASGGTFYLSCLNLSWRPDAECNPRRAFHSSRCQWEANSSGRPC